MDMLQKARAIDALAGIKIGLDMSGNWMCDTKRMVEIKDGPILKGTCGYGKTVDASVDEMWRCLTEIKPHEVLVMDASGVGRKHFRWNGFMWDEKPAPAKAEAT